jgi:hypothetical protein
MAAFVIASVLGAIVAVVYVTLAVRSFLHVRNRALAGIGEDIGDDRTFEEQGRRFNWKATGGVVASIAIISALSLGGGWWYFVPFLAIGSSIAVVVAFLIDDPARNR